MRKPWDRLPNETEKAFKAFKIYLEMDDGKRNLTEVYRILYDKPPDWNSRPTFFNDWIVNFKWKERVAEYQRFLQDEHDDEVVKHTRKTARKWAKRQEQVREDEWAIREKLMKKIERMLMFDVSRQRIEDGGKTIIIEPVDFKFRHLPAILKAFVEISRLSVDMPTSKKEISIKDVREEIKKLSNQLGVDVDVDEAIALAMQLAESEVIH